MHAQLDNPTIIHIGQRLAEAGSILSILLLSVCLVGEVYSWVNYRRTLSLKSQKVYVLSTFTERSPTDNALQILTGNLMVKPLLCLRMVYLCLAIFNLDSADRIWNPLTGSTAALVCMALIPEFVTVLVYLWVGFTIDPNGTVEEAVTFSFPEESGPSKCGGGK